MSDNLTVLTGTAETKAQDFVLRTQQVAEAEGFGHVSKIWYNQTMSYDDGLAMIEQGKAETEDIRATVAEVYPTVTNGKAVFHFPDGREFHPTLHAVGQLGTWAQTGTWYVRSLLEDTVNADDDTVISKRDSQDAEALCVALKNGLRKIDPAKRFIWRTKKDGSLRAFLTEKYAIVDNRWLLERFREFVPGGRLSHFDKGDSDTVYGNILIPDTIRAEEDSDYGGMLSIGNSEIGIRRVSSVPSIFRAICMNGCIWGAVAGKGIRQVHRGKINLDELALEIKENLNRQIPLLPQGIDRLLNTRTYAWDGASGVTAKIVVAAVAKDAKMTKRQASTVLQQYVKETSIVPAYARSLFAVANAVTRAAQVLPASDYVRFDEIGGELSEYTRPDFNSLINKAKAMKVKDVEETFAGVK